MCKKQDLTPALSWTKTDGSGALAVQLQRQTLAVDYGKVDAASFHGLQKLAVECTLHVFRQQREVETEDISVEDETGCDRADLWIQDLNFDGHADLQHAIDSPGHNTSFQIELFNPKTQSFEDGGVLTEPMADAVHRNIVVTIHYSCCAHSTAIYRYKKGALEPSLIEEQIPCSSRKQRSKINGQKCVENYFYNYKRGRIEADLEDEPSTNDTQQLAQ